MDQDKKNRFNEKRPFDVVRAEDFGGDLYEFYEPLEKLVRKVSGVDITDSRTLFLIGGRGTGKTMVLKFLSLEMQLKHFIKFNLKKNVSIEELNPDEMRTFLKEKNYVGIYLRFKTTEYDSLNGDVAYLFIPYFALKIAEQLFKFLLVFKSCGLISSREEKNISKYFCHQIKEPKGLMKNDFVSILSLITQEILCLFETIFEKS